MNSNKQTRRKLQFAGNSSYVLTLPKAWIVSQNLDNNSSEVLIQELSDSTLRISPADLGMETKDDPHFIFINEESDPEEVVRRILAAYLASKPQIIIKTKQKSNMIPLPITLKINEIISKLWGSEITAETSNEVVIQDALDPSSMSIEDLVAKAWFTAQNMLDLAFVALFEKNETAKSTVENSENTLDKLYYLALRQLYKASSNYIFASEIGIKPKDIIDYHLLAKNIERIGDHSTQLVQHVDKEFENTDELEELSMMIKNSTALAIEAFRDLDEDAAQEAISQKQYIIDRASEIDFTYNELPLSRSILRIADYSADIGELVINRIVSKDGNEL